VSKKNRPPKRPKGKKGRDPITGNSINGTWSTVGSALEEGDLPWNFGGSFTILKVTQGEAPYSTYYSLVKDAINPSADTWRVTGYADNNRNGKFGDSSNDIIGDATLRVINRSVAPSFAEIPPSDTILYGTFKSSSNTISYFIGGQLIAEAVYEKSPWTTLPSVGF
jgi:hypothetical protein